MLITLSLQGLGVGVWLVVSKYTSWKQIPYDPILSNKIVKFGAVSPLVWQYT